MSRSGYNDCDGDTWALICWRGAVASSIRGKRGQAFLREMRAAMDALPVPRLVRSALVSEEGCCAMGTVAVARDMDVSEVDPYERDMVAAAFDIAEALAAERIAYENDEQYVWDPTQRRTVEETPEQRFIRMRAWVDEHIRESDAP